MVRESAGLATSCRESTPEPLPPEKRTTLSCRGSRVRSGLDDGTCNYRTRPLNSPSTVSRVGCVRRSATRVDYFVDVFTYLSRFEHIADDVNRLVLRFVIRARLHLRQQAERHELHAGKDQQDAEQQQRAVRDALVAERTSPTRARRTRPRPDCPSPSRADRRCAAAASSS